MSISVPSPARARRGLAALLGLASVLAAASPAAAAPSGVYYNCKFPALGSHSISLSVSSDYPASAPGDTLVSTSRVRFEATDTAGALASLDVVRISGRADLAATASRYGQSTVIAELSDWQAGGSGPIVLKGEGQGPGFEASWDEPTKVSTGDLRLTLKAQKSDGSYVILPPLTNDADGQLVTWADNDPTTIEVSCAPQEVADTTFATIANERGCWVAHTCAAPAKPTGVLAVPVYATRATVQWNKVQDPSLLGHFVKFDGEDEERSVGTSGSFQLTDLTPATRYAGTIRARSRDSAVADSAPVAIAFTTKVAGPPSAPTVTVAAISSRTVTLTWPVPSSPSRVGFYSLRNIEWDGTWAGEYQTAATTDTSFTWTNLTPNRKHLFEVVATNAAGESASTKLYVTTAPLCNCGLEPPPYVGAQNVGSSTLALHWTAPPNADLYPVRGYEVYRDGTLIGETTNLVLAAQGLTQLTDYTFTVRAVGVDGQRSPESYRVYVRTSARPIPVVKTWSYALTGSATIATLIRGQLPLKGSSTLNYTPQGDGHRVDGVLDLGKTSGRLVALGFLPVTAKVGFVSSGRATGWQGGFLPALSLEQQVRIKVMEARLFGAIPLVGGNNCQSKKLTDLNLFTPGFSLAKGGTVTGKFSISDLNGCGALNGLVSPITASDANTISVTFAPAASPPATS